MRLRDQAGFSVIEGLVAITVFAITSAALGSTLAVGGRAVALQRGVEGADSSMQKIIEQAQSLGGIGVARTWCPANPGAPQATCTPVSAGTGSNGEALTVTVSFRSANSAGTAVAVPTGWNPATSPLPAPVVQITVTSAFTSAGKLHTRTAVAAVSGDPSSMGLITNGSTVGPLVVTTNPWLQPYVDADASADHKQVRIAGTLAVGQDSAWTSGSFDLRWSPGTATISNDDIAQTASAASPAMSFTHSGIFTGVSTFTPQTSSSVSADETVNPTPACIPAKSIAFPSTGATLATANFAATCASITDPFGLTRQADASSGITDAELKIDSTRLLLDGTKFSGMAGSNVFGVKFLTNGSATSLSEVATAVRDANSGVVTGSAYSGIDGVDITLFNQPLFKLRNLGQTGGAALGQGTSTVSNTARATPQYAVCGAATFTALPATGGSATCSSGGSTPAYYWGNSINSSDPTRYSGVGNAVPTITVTIPSAPAAGAKTTTSASAPLTDRTMTIQIVIPRTTYAGGANQRLIYDMNVTITLPYGATQYSTSCPKCT